MIKTKAKVYDAIKNKEHPNVFLIPSWTEGYNMQ
jgi:hypothetical protein